jgi:polysaccharide biosynthesis/export protein
MRTTFNVSLAVAAAVLLGACATPKHEFSPVADLGDTNTTSVVLTNMVAPELLKADDALFTLGPGDRLELQILGSPTTRTTTSVGPDGKIYFHLLPGMDVWGLTLQQAREQMERELAKYMNDPHIEMTLREVGSKYVWLLGRLNRPGIYPLQGPMSLLEGLAQAGGAARSTSQTSSEELADLRHSFVLRKGQVIPVDFYRLLREGDTSQNIILQPDDFVFLPSALEQEVYILGQVTIPRTIPYFETMTLVSAISGGGGPSRWDYLVRDDSGPLLRDANLSHVTIVRGSLAQPQVIVVDYGAILGGKAKDVPLEPGDIIYVPNSPFRFLKSYVNMIVNTFVATVAANEGIRAGGAPTAVGVSVPVGGTP